MLSFYQCLDAQMEQKVLLMSVARLDYLPALGEIFEINGIEFNVIKIKHKLNTATMQHDLEYYLIKTDDLYDFEYVLVKDEYNSEFDDEYDDDRGF